MQSFIKAERFYHKTLKKRDGKPVEARRNGATKLWKTRPDEFKIPVKTGMYDHHYITHENMEDWTV